MSGRFGPDLEQTPSGNGLYASDCRYHQRRVRNDNSPSPEPPVRDSSTLKSVRYGPGHEKFPSWPVPANEAGSLLSVGGVCTRTNSWTDSTDYPKEKVTTYVRPYMKRQLSQHNKQKLLTVMENCEKISSDTFKSHNDSILESFYMPKEHQLASPPERECPKVPHRLSIEDTKLTERGLEEFMEYNREYEDSLFGSIYSTKSDEKIMTQIHHQKQVSYAQSEGYHSYVSSNDSTATPFLDRLRRDSEVAAAARPQSSSSSWEEESCVRRKGRDSVVTTSSSSNETLKWHGSTSDLSVASSSYSHSANQSRPLIVHSAKVQTPQRYYSKSIPYRDAGETPSRPKNNLKLFPVYTYTVEENQSQEARKMDLGEDRKNRLTSQTPTPTRMKHLDLDKKSTKVPDPSLKDIQKKALLSFYERHQHNNNTWRGEKQTAQAQQPVSQSRSTLSKNKVALPTRRASSASDYASLKNSRRSSFNTDLNSSENAAAALKSGCQHNNSCCTLSKDLLGPVIVGSPISVDDYVLKKPPDLPPKNPNLRKIYPDLFPHARVPSPDLPPPPLVLEDEVFDNGDPLPPPPPECRPRLQDRSPSLSGKTFGIPLDEIQRVNVADEKSEKPVLPDVLPVNARSPPSPYKKYSTRLNLSSLEMDDDLMKSHQDISFHCAPLVTSTVTSSSCVISSINSVDPVSDLRNHHQRESDQELQRSEIVLRVNSGLIEAQIPDDDNGRTSDSGSDRLSDVLVPKPEYKRATQYVEDLFKLNISPRRRDLVVRSRARNSPSSDTSSSVDGSAEQQHFSLPLTSSQELISPLPSSSTYFTTSEPKAKFLTMYSEVMRQCSDVTDTEDLCQKKEELVNRLDKKLQVLRSEALIVSEECRVNDELGINVENYINRVASPHEVAKFRLHVEEVGKITSLLLGLSGRLARAENALMTISGDLPEKTLLESKRNKLQVQLEEARKLKESIDKRSANVSNILYKYLSSEEYADYDHFINMKAKLIMDSKEINDKIKLGEEQLGALRETLIVTD